MLALGSGALALAASPAAGPGFSGCASSQGGACAKVPAGALAGTSGIAISPDGGSVFASAFAGAAVSALDTVHGLSLRGCVAEGGAHGCGSAPSGTLDGPAGVAVNPAGDIYVAGEIGGTVTRLRRSGTGLNFNGCIGAAELTACEGGAVAPSLRGATALAFGPGGRDLYVASAEGAALTRLLPTHSGAPRPAGCLAYRGSLGCRGIPENSLAGASAIAVSPRGDAVYVVAYASAALTELRRGPSGALRYRGCTGDAGVTDCRPLPRSSLTGASGIAVSPGGDAVYVASQVGTLSRFAVTPSGRLAFAGCIADDGLAGCATAPRGVLAGAAGVAVAPGGEDVYVTGRGAGTLVHLRVGPRGSMRVADCLSPAGAHGCRRVPKPALGEPYALALDPKRADLYLTNGRRASVAGFDLPAGAERSVGAAGPADEGRRSAG